MCQDHRSMQERFSFSYHRAQRLHLRTWRVYTCSGLSKSKICYIDADSKCTPEIFQGIETSSTFWKKLPLLDKLEFGSGACARAMRHVVPLSHRRQAVFHAQRQLRFHTPEWAYLHTRFACNSLSVATSYRCMSSGTSCLPKELKFANIGILNALETFSQGTEVYYAMSIGCTAAYAAVTGRRCAAQ